MTGVWNMMNFRVFPTQTLLRFHETLTHVWNLKLENDGQHRGAMLRIGAKGKQTS